MLPIHDLPVPRIVRFCLIITAPLCLLQAQVNPALAGSPAAKSDLTPKRVVGELCHVRVQFELDGELTLKADGENPAKSPVKVKAQLAYDEKTLQMDAAGRAASSTVRHYESAQATIEYRQGALQPRLREDRRIVAVSAPGPHDVILYSPLGPLDHDELDLIDVPANSALIDVLLPGRPVGVGETWSLQTDWLAPLLGLDAVHTSSIACKLDRVEKHLATVHVQGTISGSVDGVASEMTLAAKLGFDTQLKRITWYAMSLREKRAVGHAHPGLEATARVQLTVQPRSQVPALHADILADLPLTADPASQLLEFRSPTGGFELLADRRWHVLIERPDVSVLRMVERGDLIAQVNISALPPLEEGETFTIVDFQQDVQRALDKHFGEFITASESITDTGLHVMRVETTGQTNGLAIAWIYYHVSDDTGRRLACVFTCESALAERFAAVDQSLVSSLRLVGKTAGRITDAAAKTPTAGPSRTR